MKLITPHTMSTLRKLLLLLLLCLLGLSCRITMAEEANDDATSSGQNSDGSSYSAGNDYIKYWTDYAILPKRCIV
jgi:hypothetical protein